MSWQDLGTEESSQAASWVEKREEYQAIAHSVCRRARLTTKDGVVWQITGRFLQVLSWGRFSQRDFVQRFATTFGSIQAYPRAWDSLSKSIIAHESRHTFQFLFAGWFVPLLGWTPGWIRVWVGVIPMALVYGFFPLPMGLAWGRFRLEVDAEVFAWNLGLKQGWLTEDDVHWQAERLAHNVSSAAYLWAWPRRWARKRLLREAQLAIKRNKT